MPVSRKDPMKKLSKEKRNRLILVVLVTGVGLAGLWFGLIHFQNQALQEIVNRKIAAQAKFDKVEQAINNADRLETELVESSKKLADLEDDTAPAGDPYAWMYTKI